MFNYLELSKKKTLLIVPSILKNKIREEIMSFNILLDIKLMSIEEVKNHLFFEKKDEAFTYIHYNYHKPLSIINTLINYLYYIDLTKEYQNNKIKELQNIKNDLLNKNLVKINKRFSLLLKNYDIKLLGFINIDKETQFIINELNKYSKIEILNYYSTNYTPSLVHTKNIEDEITYVAYSISKLLEKNIDINKIKIANLNDDYYFYLKRIFKNYNLDISLNSQITLFDLPLTNIFINLLKEYSKEETINILKEKYSNYLEYINLYISILNKYTFLEHLDLNLIIYELKNIKLKENKKNNTIEVIDLKECANSDDYIFIMSTNYNYFPKILKDEDYLIDKEKELIGLTTSKEKNKENIFEIKTIIHSSKNVCLSYKDYSYFNEYHKVDFLDYLKEDEFNKDILDSFSENEDKLLLSKNLDKHINNDFTKILNNNYHIDYLTYNSNYKGINEDTLSLALSNKDLIISYSSLNTYYECPFKYYLNNILKLNEFKDTVSTIIGKIMHEVIENCYNSDFDFEKSFNHAKEKYLADINLKESELFFINNIKSRTLDVVNYLKNIENETLLTNHLHEKKIEFNIELLNKKITIKGFIDKIIYKVIENTIYLAIIDLKTGNQDIDTLKFEHGLNLQLPFYVYLIKNNPDKFKDSKILGLYIHNILNKINDDKSLKYKGLTLNSLESIKYLDKTYSSSSFINGLKVKNDGSFAGSAKLINEEDLENYSSLVKEKIDEMIKNIYDCNFKINPKMINDKDVSCKYCQYSKICYKTIKNYTFINLEKGNDDNA